MRFARLMALAAFAVFAAAAAACEAPRISDERLQQAARDIGQASFQSEPATVIVRVTFSGPDAAPLVETVFAGGNKRFAEAVVAEASALRLPCATATTPVTSLELRRMSVQNSGFMWHREAEPRLKPELRLVDVIRLVKDIKSQAVRFDTRDMGCPFDLRFAPMRPYLPNSVQETGTTNPNRAALMEWLRNVTLDLPRDLMTTAIGRESQMAVPCVVLDLS